MVPANPQQINPKSWNKYISSLPGAHLLQTWEWGKVKSQFGWQPHHVYWLRKQDQIEQVTNKNLDENKINQLVAAAQILHRKISIGGFSHHMGVIYVPKGPLLDWTDVPLRKRVLQDLEIFAQKHSAIFVKIDPDVEVGTGIPGANGSTESPLGIDLSNELRNNGWQFSDEQIQFRNTVIIDLHSGEDELLARMKQKTRYNINLSLRKGVTVHPGNITDLPMLFKMYAETSIRDGFVIRNEKYYHEIWSTYIRNQNTSSGEQPVADALIAEAEGIPIAGVIIFRFSGKAWYLYGMSSLAHREKMPNYLLQWEAIRRSKAANCTVYDLWGAPDEFVENDPLWGVYRFKEGFGGTVHRYIGAWDLPLNRVFYRLYSKTLPGLLDIMRKHGKSSTKQAIGE
jgi:lipid II:glycine glycyltransferase (peptidoglycan interpeptide bridge formation enzyme)